MTSDSLKASASMMTALPAARAQKGLFMKTELGLALCFDGLSILHRRTNYIIENLSY